MRRGSWATLIGYDSKLLSSLSASSAQKFALLGEAWLLSTVLLSAPLGYAAWLSSHSLLAAALGASAMALFVLNLLRLVAAGGGAAPHFRSAELRNYSPAWGSTVLIGLLAVLMAQLAQLPLHRGRLDPEVNQYRQALIAQHARGQAALGLANDNRYGAELERSEFLVLRLQHMWQEPEKAARYSLFFCLLVLTPALLARLYALDALREYERIRHQQSRSFIRRETREARRTVDELLAAWPTFQIGAPLTAHAPFDAPLRGPVVDSARRKKRATRSWRRLWRRP